jgi:hypothetical protein
VRNEGESPIVAVAAELEVERCPNKTLRTKLMDEEKPRVTEEIEHD